ncbi:MAG: hypothetical protein ACYS14_14910, partial [Planctomycetota bacterium]
MRHRLCNLILLPIVLTVASGSLDAGDWPMFRADAARTGYCTEPLPEKLELLWVHRSRTAPMPAWPDSARITYDFAYQPIIVGDSVIFVSSSEDKVVAIDASSGR